ncbi:MAG TPA: DUF2891 domain-containing protein [Casimicrobiaceae bacterium]
MNPSAELTRAIAEQFARNALANIAREYPAKLDHVLGCDADAAPPRVLHPAFYGSYDWHSCVHMHWLLARVRHVFPDLACRDEIVHLFDARLSPDAIAVEVAYLARPGSASFERTYGWAWLLKLADELERNDDDDARRWAQALAPLADAFADRYEHYLPRAGYAIRHGMHANSAFGLVLALDYARGAGASPRAPALLAACLDAAREWYGGDRNAPAAYEPSGADFLSPSLVEAALMGCVLEQAAYERWLAAFLPGLQLREPANLFAPASVADRSDPQTVHLDGLNLSRAWCFAAIAGALAADSRLADSRVADHRLANHRLASVLQQAADAHLAAGWKGLESGDYAGGHWLATFGLLALEARDAMRRSGC